MPVHFTAEEAFEFVQLHGHQVRKTASVTAVQLAEDSVWFTARGDKLTGRAGDWVLSDGASEWTCDATIFAATYEQRPDGRYTKTATTMVAQMGEPFTIDTLEGPASGVANDWIAAGDAGDVWPVPNEYAERNYERV